MAEHKENSTGVSVKQEGGPGEIAAEASAQGQVAGFYVSTHYQINQHFHDEQVEWINTNVGHFEEVVIARHHFLWLEPFFEAWFKCWLENKDGMYCPAEEADDIVDWKKNILRILTMHIEARWTRLLNDPEEDPQMVQIRLGILDYLHKFLDHDFN